MDCYGNDPALSDLDDAADLNELLQHDVFARPHASSGAEASYGHMDDWLDSFFDDPVLNDPMMSDAMTCGEPHIKSEHSYSMANNNHAVPATAAHPAQQQHPDIKELDNDLLGGPAMSMALVQHVAVKQEAAASDAKAAGAAAAAPTVIKPTIILAAPAPKQERLVLPKVNIKVEPASPGGSCSSADLPPTPPSSNSSDSEAGSASPQRASPCSAVRLSSKPASQLHRAAYTTQPLLHQSMSASGVLMLSEEEKRTLITEGYPVPSKLPLTKQEEKNLKKIRRKIKNKISAQESRRKKKEYLETLEKRVEAFSQENSELKKKMEQLESNNRSLVSQLHKLQSVVGRAAAAAAGTSTQTGTCLMVLVLCFALLLGTWSPLCAGFASPQPRTGGLSQEAKGAASASGAASAASAAAAASYATPSLRSRVLLSLRDESEEPPPGFGPRAATPTAYRALLSAFWQPQHQQPSQLHRNDPALPDVVVVRAASAAAAAARGENASRSVPG